MTYLETELNAEPTRIVIGDSVTFSLPGLPHSIYNFARSGSAITVTETTAAG